MMAYSVQLLPRCVVTAQVEVTTHTPCWQDGGVSTPHLFQYKVSQLSLSVGFKKLLAPYLFQA